MDKKKNIGPEHKKVVVKQPVREKEPEYMVQIGDPKMLRKDVLESLREVIIFMQGYEKFRAIQEEKVNTFTQLRGDVRALASLVEKLKRVMPKGKWKPLASEEKHPLIDEEEEATEETDKTSESPADNLPPADLDELEDQLKDIENQLKEI